MEHLWQLRGRPMLLDLLSRLYQIAIGLLIPIPLENVWAKLYVLLDILAKLLVLGNNPEGGLLDILPF
jgi:hypothetical protein